MPFVPQWCNNNITAVVTICEKINTRFMFATKELHLKWLSLNVKYLNIFIAIFKALNKTTVQFFYSTWQTLNTC